MRNKEGDGTTTKQINEKIQQTKTTFGRHKEIKITNKKQQKNNGKKKQPNKITEI